MPPFTTWRFLGENVDQRDLLSPLYAGGVFDFGIAIGVCAQTTNPIFGVKARIDQVVARFVEHRSSRADSTGAGTFVDPAIPAEGRAEGPPVEEASASL